MNGKAFLAAEKRLKEAAVAYVKAKEDNLGRGCKSHEKGASLKDCDCKERASHIDVATQRVLDAASVFGGLQA